MVEESAADEYLYCVDRGCNRTVDRAGLIPIRLQVYTFVVAASLQALEGLSLPGQDAALSLSSTYF